MADKKLAVVAVGGNALISDKDHLSIADQYQRPPSPRATSPT